MDETLLPPRFEPPASYEGVKPQPLDRDSTVDDICDFFMEYMQSDVVVCQHMTTWFQITHGDFGRVLWQICTSLSQVCILSLLIFPRH